MSDSSDFSVAVDECTRLYNAIKKHYDLKGDDRCWLDDDELYAAAGLPLKLPEIGDPKAMLRNCKRYIRQRCFVGGGWKSYAELEAENVALRAKLDCLKSQLPEGMEHCTIQYKECEKGHGRLTARNWVDHGCQTCERDRLKTKLDNCQS